MADVLGFSHHHRRRSLCMTCMYFVTKDNIGCSRVLFECVTLGSRLEPAMDQNLQRGSKVVQTGLNKSSNFNNNS